MAARLKLTGQVSAVALVAGLLALLVWKLAQGSGKTSEPKNFTLPLLSRPTSFTPPRAAQPGKLELSSLRGKVVVLNFWASWCVPCKQEAPMVEQIWRQFRSKGVVVVGIDTKDFSGDARSFARHYRLTYPIVRDADGALWRPYGLTGVPETRVIGRNGKYVGTQFYGAVSGADLRTAVREALQA
jgi:cytochrome c biogenesis protein CcmG, thiol:disulfide interchange protein DsbE